MNKIQHGQFYTVSNPFSHVAMRKWVQLIQKHELVKDNFLIEPFAGSNNIVKMINDIGLFTTNNWQCFDIEPTAQCDNKTNITINQLDTLEHYPVGFTAAITNPPYLAKNSATRRNLDYPDTKYDDLYKYALDVMLRNTQYVSAIVPESFITSGLFHNRIDTIISLTSKIFDDTEVPVCLALFIPRKLKVDNNFSLYSGEKFIGTYYDLKNNIMLNKTNNIKIVMNAPHGALGLIAIDSNKEQSIKFVKGENFDEATIKVSNRSFTRIQIPTHIDIDLVIHESNTILNKYRQETNDVFLTSFKGLRKDGKYRRRLDWNTTKQIINESILNIQGVNVY